jgi:hypothetical protein
MLKEYGEPQRARLSWPGKLLAFVLACLIFASAIFLIARLLSLVSPRHGRALKEEQAREEAFLRSLDFYVVDSGYVKKSSGLNEIYVPTVQVYIANSSDRIISDFWLMANFEREGKFLCRAVRRVVDLKPGENREVGLSCSEAMFMGTVFTGLSLAQTTEDLTYFIWARSNRASVTLLRDVLKFKIVKGRAPY